MTHKKLAPAMGASRVVLALALAGSLALAETPTAPAAEEIALAPVTVSAHDGVALPYDSTGVSVTVLDVEQLRKQGTLTLTEALTSVPGAYVQAGGGISQAGSASKIVLRGMSSDVYTLPLIDGMRVYNTSGAGNVASNIAGHTSLFGVGQLEILRGAQAAVYGGGAVGGVLAMNTPKGTGEPSYTVFGEAGSFDTATGSFTAQGQKDKLSYFVNVSYQTTDNDIKFADGSQPYTGAGEYSNWSESIRLDYQFNEDTSLTLTYRREDVEFKDPGDTTPMEFRSNLITAKLNTKVNEKYSTSLMLGYYGSNNVFGSNYDVPGTDYDVDLSNVQIEWSNVYAWNEKHTTTAGLAWNREEAKTSYKNSNDLNNIYAVFAEHHYKPIEKWENSVALRLDSSTIYDEKFTFRAASNYKFNQDATRVFGSVGSSYRAPSSFQRGAAGTYSNAYGTYTGNADLKCEKSYSFDFGVEQHINENHRVSATYFWQQLSDAINAYSEIDFDPNTWHTTYTCTNAPGNWTIQGVELALRGTIEKNWNTGYTIAYTVTQPKTNDDTQIAQTARQTWSADIHTSPNEKLTLGMGIVASVGRMDWDTKNGVDNYYSLRAYARYKVSDNVALHIRVENLTDQKYVTNYGGSWSPTTLNSGAAVYAGCTVTF